MLVGRFSACMRLKIWKRNPERLLILSNIINRYLLIISLKTHDYLYLLLSYAGCYIYSCKWQLLELLLAATLCGCRRGRVTTCIQRVRESLGMSISQKDLKVKTWERGLICGGVGGCVLIREYNRRWYKFTKKKITGGDIVLVV